MSPFDRPFRFSVQCSSPPTNDPASWTQLARRCETLGYDVLTVADHLDDQLAPMPALMAAADATTELRVGAMVLCNDYRHPVLVAKEAATVDLLSGGRLELGLGAGWMATDYRSAGIGMASAATRIDRLAESRTIVKTLLAGERCDLAGEHYTVSGLVGTPLPIQRPRPPILVGGGGRRVLRLAAREADIVGISTIMTTGQVDAEAAATGTAVATDEKLEWIRDAAGSRWDSLELHVRVHLAVVTDDRLGMAEALAAGFGLTPAEALASPHALCGTVDEIVDTLLERRARWGMSMIGLDVHALESFAPVVARLRGR
jgi:probable F420-dependent oxidoreductase